LQGRRSLAGDSSDEDLADEKLQQAERIGKLTTEVILAIKRHCLPPTALGMRKSGLAHKVSAILHSMYLELGSMRRLEQFIPRIFNITTDLGTESSVGELPNINLSSFLSQFQSLGYCADDGNIKNI
jgi:hypothetical protein